MSTAARGATLAPAPARDRLSIAVVVGLGAVALALDALTNGNLLAMLAPVLVLGLLALVWAVPLRWSMVTLLFLCATLEAPYEAFASYRFTTPWVIVSNALLGNLNLVTKVSAMKMSGFDLLVIYLFIVHAVRRVRGSKIDGDGFVPLARPVLVGAALSLAGILVMWAYGLSHGGDFPNSLWQLQKALYIPILLVLLHAGFRGSADLKSLGMALIIAACYRGLMAAFIAATVREVDGEPLPYATTHHDSVLFAAAFALLIILRNERVPLGRHWSTIPASVAILIGMVANGRRLVWVAVIGAMMVVALVSPWTRLKRRVARTLLISSPLIVVYLAAGWNSNSSVFKPAATIRSIVDSKSDSSSLWRDMENANLVRNISLNPWFGVGYGHEYIEFVQVDDVSALYPQYRYIPHNSVLALFAFTGALGAFCIWSLLVCIVFLAARSYHRSADPAIRAACLTCIVIVFLYVNQIYGDIFVSAWLGPITVGPAAMVAGKLAIETGAWPWAARRRPALAGAVGA